MFNFTTCSGFPPVFMFTKYRPGIGSTPCYDLADIGNASGKTNKGENQKDE
jgi:hypothetical protein